jgi:uncharacterized repeat protein (TIGR03803 family)
MRLLSGCILAILATAGLFARTLTTVFSFYESDGAGPYGGLIQGLDGNLYGTTYWNGVDANYDGTIFRLTPDGQLTSLYAFVWAVGSNPEAGLLLATNGAMYGTTTRGGATPGYGTLFAITERGEFTKLHQFQLAEGEFPQAPLIQAANGDLYGANAGFTDIDYGTLYRATPAGVVTVLHSFNGSDGENPNGPIQARDGNFYGTTQGVGGFSSANGTIFKLAPNNAFTTLYRFTGGADGDSPFAALVEASDGNFYGTTSGYWTGNGTVFRFTPAGNLITLHAFTGGADGSSPVGALIQATDGNLYGTTSYGGTGPCSDGCGTVFRIAPDGRFTTVHHFQGTDGSGPEGALLQATDGNIYGTTVSGGPHRAGTVFRLSIGRSPFVSALPASGSVGDTVRILGSNLTEATSVAFNGTPATFTVNASGGAITTTIPAGATTGEVQVTTPSGVLSSNVAFVVR